jgi:predicted nucleic acid-binding protein
VIALDSSAIIAFLQGDDTAAAAAAGMVLGERQACLPPAVLTEVLSDPKLPKRVADLIAALPVLEVSDGYWRRAGALRSQVLAAGHRARLADTLIAQSCLDHDVSLVSSDRDFRHFAKAGGLRLLP